MDSSGTEPTIPAETRSKQPTTSSSTAQHYRTEDFDGQAKAEKLSRFIITLFGAVGFIWGGVIQQFSQTVLILCAGFLLAVLITVPPWPIYRRKPLNWQKVKVDSEESKKKKK